MAFDRLTDRARRANIVRVLTVYLSACFVALQLVDMFSDRLSLPRSTFTATLVLAIVGLPIVILIAMTRVPAAANVESAPVTSHHWLTWQRVGISVLSLFALWGLVAAAWLVIGPRSAA